MVWFEELLDPIKRPIFKIHFSRNSKSSVWNTNFTFDTPWKYVWYSMKVRQTILFVSEPTYPEDTPYQVWFDLKNFSTRKKGLFLKFLLREIQKVPYEKLTFFLGKLYQKFFLFYILITLVILHAEFGLIWTTPWPDKISIFLKIEWANNKRISRYSRLKYELFSRKVRRTFFLSQSLPTLGIHHTKFGLIRTTSWPDKKDLILSLLIWKNRKFPYEKLNFFLGKLYKKLLLLYTFITLVIIHTKCGSFWTTPWTDKNSIFLKIENSKKSIFSIETRTFFYES